MSNKKKFDLIKDELEILESEFTQNKGDTRFAIKKAYLKLQQTCGKNCKSTDPIFFDRL